MKLQLCRDLLALDDREFRVSAGGLYLLRLLAGHGFSQVYYGYSSASRCCNHLPLLFPSCAAYLIISLVIGMHLGVFIFDI